LVNIFLNIFVTFSGDLSWHNNLSSLVLRHFVYCHVTLYFPTSFSLPIIMTITLSQSEAWSGVNWADLMAAQGAFGTDFYDRSTRTIVATMLWTEYRPVIKICPKGALGSHEIRPIHSAPSLRQSIFLCCHATLSIVTTVCLLPPQSATDRYS